MPVVAIAGAISGAAALTTGTLTVMQTIAAIGGIVSGIGAITGSKTLTKIGAVASLAGGLGAFAQSKGWLASGSAAQTAADAASGTSGIDLMKATPSGAEAGAVINPQTANFGGAAGSNAAELGQGIVQGATEQTTAGLAGADITRNIAQQSPEVASAMGPAGATPPGAVPPAAEAPKSLFEATAPATQGAAQAASSTVVDATKTLGAGAAKTADASIFEKLTGFAKDLGKFAKENKELTSIAANFIGGVFDDEKKARTEFYETRSQIERQQMENASSVPAMHFSLNQRKPVFPKSRPQYRGVGLFNAR